MSDTATPTAPTDSSAPVMTEVERLAAEAIQKMVDDARQNVATIEPAEDEDTESIEYVRTGWIHVTIDGTRYRLRPVTMGKLKTLRMALEDLQESQRVKINTTQRQLRALAAEGRKLDEVPEHDRDEENYYGPSFEISRKIRRLNRALQHAADDARLKWFGQVFELLSVGDDGKPSIPEELGAWASDDGLPDKWIKHWRTVPLGRG